MKNVELMPATRKTARGGRRMAHTTSTTVLKTPPIFAGRGMMKGTKKNILERGRRRGEAKSGQRGERDGREAGAKQRTSFVFFRKSERGKRKKKEKSKMFFFPPRL